MDNLLGWPIAQRVGWDNVQTPCSKYRSNWDTTMETLPKEAFDLRKGKRSPNPANHKEIMLRRIIFQHVRLYASLRSKSPLGDEDQEIISTPDATKGVGVASIF